MWQYPWNVPNVDQPVFWESSQVVDTIKSVKHLRNLKKWHKFIKRNKIFLRFEYSIHWVLKPNWKLSTVWTGKLAQNPLQSIILRLRYLPFWLTVIELQRGVKRVASFLRNFQKWRGGYCNFLKSVASFLKNFQKWGGGYCNFLHLSVLVIFYVVFVATESHHPDSKN